MRMQIPSHWSHCELLSSADFRIVSSSFQTFARHANGGRIRESSIDVYVWQTIFSSGLQALVRRMRGHSASCPCAADAWPR